MDPSSDQLVINHEIQMREIVITNSSYENITNNEEFRSRSSRMEMEVYNAALSGSIEGIKKYLEEQQQQLPLTPTGNSVLHLHVAAPFYQRPARLDFIRYLLSCDGSLVWHRNDDGETALHLAASFDQLYAVQKLIVQVQQPRDLLLISNKEGDTALHMAVRNRHPQLVHYLVSVDLQADQDQGQGQVEYAANAAGETPLSLAAGNRSMWLLEIVLRTTSRPDEAALLTAVMRGNPGMVRKILQRFPQLINTQYDKGQTALHYAAGFDINSLKVLLFENDSSAVAYTQDIEGRTAAHIAALRNNVPGLRLLMDRFPSSYELVDHQHRNVVHYAAFLGLPQALGYFLQDIRFRPLVNKRDKDGNTPLHLLASCLTDIPTPYVSAVRKLIIPKLYGLRWRIFNNEDLTAGDIALSYKIAELEPVYQGLVVHFLRVAPGGGGRTKSLLPTLEDQKSLIDSRKKSYLVLCTETFRKTARDHAVVAALIATVSFTAGLAVPGGFDQTTGTKDGGTAILTKKAAFQAFLVSDAVALTSSFIAILLYFLIALEQLRYLASVLLLWGFIASAISMVSLMVAYMAGTYSIVWQSTPLSVIIILIASTFMLLYAVFVLRFIRSVRNRFFPKDMSPRRFKRQVRYGRIL